MGPLPQTSKAAGFSPKEIRLPLKLGGRVQLLHVFLDSLPETDSGVSTGGDALHYSFGSCSAKT